MINNLHIVLVSNNPSDRQLQVLLKCNNELAKTSNDELSTFKQFKTEFFNDSLLCHWYIFYLNNTPIGGAMIMDPDENCQAFSIGNIIIYQEFRHFGYGKQCLSLLLNYIKHLNPILPIYLGVETSNIVAIHLYQEFGFKIIKTFNENNKRFYQMCLGTPLITEEINNLVKNNIKNNLVYHASPFKLDILKGTKTSKWSNEVGNVFVTPCKGIAACFLINKTQILDKLSQQFSGKIIGLNFGYDVWNKPIQELYEIPNNINILLNLPSIKPFSGISTGYIYTIDFSKYKNNCHMFNKNPNSDVQFLIEGDINFIKCEQITVNWICMSNQEQIKRHGIAKIIQIYDPPYTYEQMLKAGYSQQLAQKLKNDPVHGWRMQTGIELVHQQPSLAEQKRVWKNWQLMSPEQKEISQKKSLQLFGKTNEQHYKEIMNNYWKEPIFESKFQKLFQLIMEAYEAEYLPISSNRCLYVKQSGHCIDRFLERFWQDISKEELLNILQYIFFQLDKYIEIKFHIYCDKSLIMLPIIINNKIGNILTIRQMENWEIHRTKNKQHQDFKIVHLNI